MKNKNIKLFTVKLFSTISILLLLFGIYLLFPLSTDVVLIKIHRQRDADSTVLYSPEIKIVQELNSCFISYVKTEFSHMLSHAGYSFEVLDEETREKSYYLVHCPFQQINDLASLGNVKQIEENIVLFWTDGEDARQILPASFRIVRLPDESLYSFKRKSLNLGEILPTSIGLPSGLRTNPVVSEIIKRVSGQNLTNYIQTLQNFQTRYASSANCELSGTFIHDFFIQSGIQTEYDSFSFSTNNTSRNIIGTLQGTVDPTQIVIICAHYDSFSNQSLTLAPGADDNASGTAAVMEAARIFSDYSFDFTVKFICFSAEELGLFGSKNYALNARQQGEEIIALINLDMIGYTDILPEDLDIISNPASEWLADRFFSVTLFYTPLNINKIISSSFIWSDHSPFWDNGYNAIIGIEDINVNYTNPYFHTIYDTIDTLNFDFITDVVKASLASAADLAQPVSNPRTPTGLNSRSQIVSSLFTSRKSVYLTWNTNQDSFAGYNIYKTITSHTDYQKLNTDLITQTEYVERNLDPDTSYYYVVTATDSQGNESNYSKEVKDNREISSKEYEKEKRNSRNMGRLFQ